MRPSRLRFPAEQVMALPGCRQKICPKLLTKRGTVMSAKSVARAQIDNASLPYFARLSKYKQSIQKVGTVGKNVIIPVSVFPVHMSAAGAAPVYE